MYIIYRYMSAYVLLDVTLPRPYLVQTVFVVITVITEQNPNRTGCQKVFGIRM